MVSTYICPKIVNLDELHYTKLDVSPGTAEMTPCDFCIREFGYIDNLTITVNRDGNNGDGYIRKATNSSGVVVNTTSASLLLSDSNNNTPVPLTYTHFKEQHFHENFLNSSVQDPTQLLQGSIFNILITYIFSNTDTSVVDFTSGDIRTNNIFFYGDSTSSLVSDVLEKTLSGFNEQIDYDESNNASVAEFQYWNTRTSLNNSLESEEVSFYSGDAIYVYYKLDLRFVLGNSSQLVQNEAIATRGSIDSSSLVYDPVSSPNATFNNIQTQSTFVLEWNIYNDNTVPEIEASVLAGPYKNIDVIVSTVNESTGVKTELQPHLTTDDEGKVVFPRSWNIPQGSTFIIDTNDDSSNAVDTTLEGSDMVNSSPTMLLKGAYKMNNTEQFYVTPTTTLIYDMIEDSTIGVSSSSIDNATIKLSSSIGIESDNLYNSHYVTGNEELMDFTTKLQSVMLSINDITKNESEAFVKVDSLIGLGMGEFFNNSVGGVDLGNLDDIGEMIEKAAVKKHGSIGTYNNESNRIKVQSFVSLTSGIVDAPGESHDTRVKKRLSNKKLLTKMFRDGRHVSDITDVIVNTELTSLEEPQTTKIKYAEHASYYLKAKSIDYDMVFSESASVTINLALEQGSMSRLQHWQIGYDSVYFRGTLTDTNGNVILDKSTGHNNLVTTDQNILIYTADSATEYWMDEHKNGSFTGVGNKDSFFYKPVDNNNAVSQTAFINITPWYKNITYNVIPPSSTEGQSGELMGPWVYTVSSRDVQNKIIRMIISDTGSGSEKAAANGTFYYSWSHSSVEDVSELTEVPWGNEVSNVAANSVTHWYDLFGSDAITQSETSSGWESTIYFYFLINDNVTESNSFSFKVFGASGEDSGSNPNAVPRSQYWSHGNNQTGYEFSIILPIVTNGLVLNVDAANSQSYPGSGTTWTDLSGHGNDITLHGGVGYNSNNGGALSLDGSNGRLTGHLSGGGFTSEYTMIVWFKFDQETRTAGSGRMDIIYGLNNKTQPMISFDGDGDGRLNYHSLKGGDPLNMKSTTSTWINKWYMIALSGSRTQERERIYVDGILENEVNDSIGSYIAWTGFSTGFRNFGGGVTTFFHGQISAYQFYDRELDSLEVQQNFNALRTRYGL